MSYSMVFSRHRSSVGSVVACLLAVLVVGVANAHVGVLPREAPPDTSQTFSVRVPTEQETPTIQVRVEFPAGLTVSRFQPKPGWQREVQQDGSGRITAVTWSGGQIQSGEYDEFTFIARTPKEPGPLVFKAYQTYQGGEVVEWVNAEGDNDPAPVVAIQAAGAAAGGSASGDHGEHAAAAATGVANEAPVAATAVAATTVAEAPAASAAAAGGAVSNGTAPGNEASTNGGSDLPLFASIGALVTALIALALSGVALARRPGSA